MEENYCLVDTKLARDAAFWDLKIFRCHFDLFGHSTRMHCTVPNVRAAGCTSDFACCVRGGYISLHIPSYQHIVSTLRASHVVLKCFHCKSGSTCSVQSGHVQLGLHWWGFRCQCLEMVTSKKNVYNFQTSPVTASMLFFAKKGHDSLG